MNSVKYPDRRIIFILSIIILLSVSTHLNLFPKLNTQNSYIYGQENKDSMFTSDATNNNSSNSSLNSGTTIDSEGQSFTISCTDFMKLFDTISALDIGDQVAENKVNQTSLDDIEHIFNSYAGNCSKLDEYEFE